MNTSHSFPLSPFLGLLLAGGDPFLDERDQFILLTAFAESLNFLWTERITKKQLEHVWV